MKIALDFDETYTLDFDFWNEFIVTAKARYSYDVRVVTYRHKDLDNIDHLVWKDVPVIYTNGVAKKFWCENFENWSPDIWIDDKPERVNNNSELDDPEKVDAWRKMREY